MRPASVPPPHLLFGITFLPEDFAARLQRFKEASGLTWDGMASCLGVDPRQLQRWRKGTRPSGDGLFALVLLAARIPGGFHTLFKTHVQPPGGMHQLMPTSGHELHGNPAVTPSPSTSAPSECPENAGRSRGILRRDGNWSRTRQEPCTRHRQGASERAPVPGRQATED